MRSVRSRAGWRRRETEGGTSDGERQRLSIWRSTSCHDQSRCNNYSFSGVMLSSLQSLRKFIAECIFFFQKHKQMCVFSCVKQTPWIYHQPVNTKISYLNRISHLKSQYSADGLTLHLFTCRDEEQIPPLWCLQAQQEFQPKECSSMCSMCVLRSVSGRNSAFNIHAAALQIQ